MEIGREYERGWEEERNSVAIGRKKKQKDVAFLGVGFWSQSLLEAKLNCYPPPDLRQDLDLDRIVMHAKFYMLM